MSDVVVPIGIVLLGVALLRARVLQIWLGVLLIAFPIMLTAFSYGLMIPWILVQRDLEIVGRVSQIVNGIGWRIFWLLFGYTLLTFSSPKQRSDQASYGATRSTSRSFIAALNGIQWSAAASYEDK